MRTLIFIAAPACATVVLVRGKIFLRPKTFVIDHVRNTYISFLMLSLFSCPLCLGFWAGVIRYLLDDSYPLMIGPGFSGWIMGLLSSGMIVSVLAKILDTIAYPVKNSESS